VWECPEKCLLLFSRSKGLFIFCFFQVLNRDNFFINIKRVIIIVILKCSLSVEHYPLIYLISSLHTFSWSTSRSTVWFVWRLSAQCEPVSPNIDHLSFLFTYRPSQGPNVNKINTKYKHYNFCFLWGILDRLFPWLRTYVSR